MSISTRSHLLKRLFNIKYPIIQAPMAGLNITTPLLVSSVCNANSLGFLASGYKNVDLLKKQIDFVKKNAVGASFGVNIFISDKVKSSCIRYKKQNGLIRLEEELKLQNNREIEVDLDEDIERKIDLCVASKIPIVSFTFGLPEKRLIDYLKKKGGVYIIATACSITEALVYEKYGVDAVVLQGSEAGGHRGSSKKFEFNDEVGLLSLLQEAKRSSLKIPYIASGGIATGDAILACQLLGAEAVQIGTGFLLTKECGASDAYKHQLLASKAENTVITNVISGKKARGIRNKLINELNNESIEPYPIQNSLTKDIRNFATLNNLPDYQSLWCGQGVGVLKNEKTAEKFIQQLVMEYEKAIQELFKKEEEVVVKE